MAKKYEFMKLSDPVTAELDDLGSKGWYIGSVVFERDERYIGFVPIPVIIMEREIEDKSEEFSMEWAVRNGIRDGFTTWIDTLSAASVIKIFGKDR